VAQMGELLKFFFFLLARSNEKNEKAENIPEENELLFGFCPLSFLPSPFGQRRLLRALNYSYWSLS